MSNRNDEFDFGDDDFQDLPEGDDFFNDFDSDLPDLEDEPAGANGGTNRTFIIVAAAMIALFVIGLIAIIFLTTRETPVPPAGLTATAVVQANMTIEFFANQTATQNAINIGLTQTADAFTDTPTPTVPTDTPTPTPSPTLDQTVQAATQQAGVALTGTALALTQTAGAPTEPPAPTAVAGLDLTAVAGTATALAGAFLTQPTDPPQVLVTPTELPDTGLFDDVAGGGGRGGIGIVALMAFGLLGVIVVSRRIRARVE